MPVILPASPAPALTTLLGSDTGPSLWWGTPVECQSALYRLHRERRLSRVFLDHAFRRLLDLIQDADVIEPTSGLRDRAGRLLASHPLRAADSLQLAAALVWCDDTPRDETFVCLDARLREAAQREGFAILPRA